MEKDYEEIRYEWELTPIELLGYAKNNIVEAIDKSNLPEQYINAMKEAYRLLDKVQEYLFEN